MRRTRYNLIEIEQDWTSLGGVCYIKSGTGDEIFRHPTLIKPIRVNYRRKDAPMELLRAYWRIKDDPRWNTRL
jgi:hypothetical protein